MKKIKLTQGKSTCVDDVDYPELISYRWYAVKNKRNWYAGRSYLLKGKKINLFMHRVVLGLKYKDRKVVDHIDDNGLNNQKLNLRVTTNRLNVANKRKNVGLHYSRYKGVTYDKNKKKWIVNMFYSENGKRKSKYIGGFKNQKEAAMAYNEAAKLWYGEFARLNKIKS